MLAQDDGQDGRIENTKQTKEEVAHHHAALGPAFLLCFDVSTTLERNKERATAARTERLVSGSLSTHHHCRPPSGCGMELVMLRAPLPSSFHCQCLSQPRLACAVLIIPHSLLISSGWPARASRRAKGRRKARWTERSSCLTWPGRGQGSTNRKHDRRQLHGLSFLVRK